MVMAVVKISEPKIPIMIQFTIHMMIVQKRLPLRLPTPMDAVHPREILMEIQLPTISINAQKHNQVIWLMRPGVLMTPV